MPRAYLQSAAAEFDSAGGMQPAFLRVVADSRIKSMPPDALFHFDGQKIMAQHWNRCQQVLGRLPIRKLIL